MSRLAVTLGVSVFVGCAVGALLWVGADSIAVPDRESRFPEEQVQKDAPKPSLPGPGESCRESAAASSADVGAGARSQPAAKEESSAVPESVVGSAAKLSVFEDQIRAGLIEAGFAEAEASDCVVAWRQLAWTQTGGNRAFAGLLEDLGSLIKAGHVRVARIKKDRPARARVIMSSVLYVGRREYVNSVHRAEEDVEFTVSDVPATKAFWNNVK
jgi:hypothetical protein